MNLFIGNLPIDLDAEGLKKLVQVHANVLGAKIIQSGGISRGFGFVMVSDDDAKVIIEKLNGKNLEGKRLSVKMSYKKNQTFKHSFISREWREKASEKL